jgi:L-lactate dehydrogenase complex protein LldE
MTVGLFIPCYVDQFYPQVAIASLQLLEKLQLKVEYPLKQSCCGQPMANAGFEHLGSACNENFIENFASYDYIVAPSGSCVLHVKEHLSSAKHPQKAATIKDRVYELTGFLTDVLQVKQLKASFPHKVGLHQSCHGLRGLKLAQMSELMEPEFSKPVRLLHMVRGIEVVPLHRQDECCGFGGTFAVSEEAVSVKMGKDRIKDHADAGAEYVTGADMSCLMHLESLLRRKKSPLKVMHIAEILNAEV